MASDVQDGSYMILSAANTGFALDSSAAQDRDGTNVQIWATSGNDAQIVRVWTAGTGQQLCFVATGKVVDVDSAKLVSGTNVQQWSRNGTIAQQWTISKVSGASSVTYGGQSYAPMKIALKASSELLLEVSGTAPSNMMNGSNVVVSTDEATALDQMWIFVPVQAVPDGTYVMHPAVDTSLAIGIAGSSQGVGAQAQIEGRNELTNAQVFLYATDDSTGQTHISAMHSSKRIEARTPVANGYPLYQATADTSSAQQWLLVPEGSTDYNGSVVPTYEIRSAATEGTDVYVMDVCGASTTIGTKLQTYQHNGTAAQRFYLEPTSIYSSSLSAPVIRGIREHGTTGTPIAGGFGEAVSKWDVVWDGSGSTEWQIRYRYRYRKAGDASLGEWTAWKNAADDSTANIGWGTLNTPTTTTLAGEWEHSYGPIVLPTLDNAPADLVEVQIETRPYVSGMQATAPGASTPVTVCKHGTSSALDALLSYRPTLSIDGATWSPDGLKIAYTTTSSSPSSRVAITSITKSDGTDVISQPYSTALAYAHNGTISMPTSVLTTIPEDGTAITITATISTEAGLAATVSANTTLEWDASHGITVTPIYEVTDRDTILTTIPKHDTDTVWLVTAGGFEECTETSHTDTTRTYEILAPLCTDYYVYYLSKASDGSWGTNFEKGRLDDKACVWNWTDDDGTARAAILRYGEGQPMTIDNSVSTTGNSFRTSFRWYPTYTYQHTIERKLDVSGVLDDAKPEKWSTSADFEALRAVHHVVFRTPYGTRYHVSVGDVSTVRTHVLTDITVSQTAETI